MIKSFDELTFADDFMFCKVMENESICKKVIESLLGIKVGHVEKHMSQYSKKITADSHGIRLDVYLKDSDRVFDIECQTTKFPSIEKRIRYYQSVIDIDHLSEGDNYSKLPESFIVFICTSDPFEAGEPVYTVKEIIEESSETIYNDGVHRILFNASAYEKVSNPLLRDFLKFVLTTEGETDLTSEIRDCVEICKGNEKWRTEYMTLEMKIREEKQFSFDEGLTKGISTSKKEIALNMLKNNLDVKLISSCTGLSESEILALKNPNEK